MKTTVDIADNLLARAKRHAKKTHQPVRALIEEGLRLVLAADLTKPTYKMPDRSVGSVGDTNPLEQLSWNELRSSIYGEK